MKTVIMAGGKGTRIAELFPDIPKPLIPITDADGVSKPVLEWELLSLAKQGYRDIILTVGYKAQQIKDYFGDGSKLGVTIEYFVETTPLGNAGALFMMRSELGDAPFLLLNADAVFDIDFNRFVEFHRTHGGLVSLFTHPNSHPYDSGIVVTDGASMVTSWMTKEDPRPLYYKNRVNAGLHIIDPAVLDMMGNMAENVGRGKKIDLDRQILKPLCGQGILFAYDSPEYVKDMGTPERFYSVSRDFQNGIVKAKNLRNKQRAIFLDRDGTINKYVGFLRKIDQFELIEGVAEAIKRINSSGYLAIMITNQPVIARGEVTIPELDEIHNKLETLLGQAGAYIDGLYYCPHHPDKGFVGEIEALKYDCDCRKPKPGMLIKASQDFNIDLSSSWMIGDGVSDIEAGKAAGCCTAFIGKENEIYNANIVADSLLDAIEQIL